MFSRRLLVFAAALAVLASPAPASVEVYLSKPQAQTVDPSFTLTSTENFNGSPQGNFTTLASTTIGAYATTAGTAKIRPNDKYGGYNQGNYLAVAVGGTTSVALNSPEAYFGIFFTAADGDDTITLYDSGGLKLGAFAASSLATFLSQPTVVATNGTTYNSSAYLGQPTADGSAPTLNTGEYYAYLNFVVTSGNNIARVDFSKSTGGTFESDNHAVKAAAPSFINSTFVDLGTVPEPTSVAMILMGAAALGAATVSRRRSADQRPA